MFKLAVVVGSLRKKSMNQMLADNLARIGSDLFSFEMVNLGDVPLFNQDLEASAFPESVTRMKSAVEAADGVLIVSPEYNRSLPAVTKNAIDWASRPPGKNSWAGKPAAACGIALSTVGTASMQSHLRPVAVMLGMVLMGQPEVYLTYSKDFFDESGKIASEGTEKFLRGFLEQFSNWVSRHKAA